MKTLQYELSGGQLYIEKKSFTSELLLPRGNLKKLLNGNTFGNVKQPKITKQDNLVSIDFNEAGDVILDEGFYDLFKQLKAKYRGKLKGRVVIRITALSSYHVVLNLNTEDDKVIYE
jgi:hypothetical protein